MLYCGAISEVRGYIRNRLDGPALRAERRFVLEGRGEGDRLERTLEPVVRTETRDAFLLWLHPAHLQRYVGPHFGKVYRGFGG